jgi:hypothetical protein
MVADIEALHKNLIMKVKKQNQETKMSHKKLVMIMRNQRIFQMMKMKFKELNKIKIKNKMGQKQTKQSEYFIPTTKNFKISYCVQETITELVEKKEYVNLSKILQEYSTLNLVLQVLYYKCKHQGYNFKEFNVIPISYRIDHILEYISDKGISLSNNAVINSAY